ncbi:MAG: hypothetical protein LIO95_03560 [Clostridiales bacterium]|nr:hypothetical protein [Clostridiales bacterium]
MGKTAVILVLGVILLILAGINFSGNISSIHWYHRRKVTPEDAPKYSRAMGIGTGIIGLCAIVTAALEAATKQNMDAVIIGGCVVGLGVMLYAQIKYNHGLF